MYPANMTRDELGRQRPEDRWPELLRVTSEVIGAKGYLSASLQDIAERMGILKGSLYHYARTKEDLLFATFSKVIGDFCPLFVLVEHLNRHQMALHYCPLFGPGCWRLSTSKFPAIGGDPFDYRVS